MRPRKREYTDIYITDGELKKVKKGYSVVKVVCGKCFSLKAETDRKTQREIDRLKKKIKHLENKA